MGKSSKNIHPKQSRQKQNKNINIKPTTKSKNKSELASLLTSCSSLCLLQNAWGSIYMAFMGDPTLRLFVVAPPTAAVAVQSQNTVRYALSLSHFCSYVYRLSSRRWDLFRFTIAPSLLNYLIITDSPGQPLPMQQSSGTMSTALLDPSNPSSPRSLLLLSQVNNISYIYIYIKDWRGVGAEHQDLTK